MTEEGQWLNADQQRAWRGFVIGTTLLNDHLDADLRREFDISLAEYEILVRLSENDGAMRMAHLADSMAHSRSRITHTIKRMERAGLVERRGAPDDGRGVVALLTDKGMDLLVRSAPTHVAGVREYLVDVCSADDYAAMGRVMNAVADKLIGDRPALEIR